MYLLCIAGLLQSISGVSDINPLVAFYDIHGEKRTDTTRDLLYNRNNNQFISIFTHPSSQFQTKFVFECANNVSILRVLTYIIDADRRSICGLILTSDWLQSKV
jgi:hypothetical protein